MKISLKDRLIPRNKVGDPCFERLSGENIHLRDDDVVDSLSYEPPTIFKGLLDVFSPSEVVELVNRALYQLEYQSKSHSKYREQRQNLERPVREMFHQLYPGESWAKATDSQLQHSIMEVKKRQ
jgi:hypothetical protein